jgi:hypothetical protein
MSTTDPVAWIAQQDQNMSMEDLWSVLLRDAWAERHDLALADIDGVDLDALLAWAVANVESFSTALADAIEAVHETPPTDDDHAEQRRTMARRAIRKLGPRAGDPHADMLGRLQSIAQDRGLDLLDLLAEAKVSGNLLSFLQKNATKGMKYENTAGAYIERHTPGTRVLCLRDAGNKLSVRFDAAGTAWINAPVRNEFSKDADLAAIRKTGEHTAVVYLISHKFARIGGGHQDNQKADAYTFLTNAARCPASDTSLTNELRKLAAGALNDPALTIEWEPALILDGDYFASAPNDLAATVNGHPAFVGNTDAFVAHLIRKAAE